jgi:aspartate/methionine/tyrosine aminotransferase
VKIEIFKMERMQSLWENVVDYNLSESGVHPLNLKELLLPGELEELAAVDIGYTQTNGTPRLRENIARLYPGIDPEQIMVTAGSSEANFLLMWSLLEPGDEVVFELPNYMQMWGLSRSFGARVKPLWLRSELGWQPDPDDLRKLVNGNTRLIILTNPNNPTGAILSREIREEIVRQAEKVGAWLLVDEVYRGAERNGLETPSFWGSYDRLVVVAGLSKAYGLPGLRLGWLVGPLELVRKIWTYHDYTTISVSALTDHLATRVLEPERRQRILKRTRDILNNNLPVLEKWLNGFNGLFSYLPPQAGAILFARYNLQINSTELVEKIMKEKSVLLVPGDHFELDQHLRFGYGSSQDYLKKALDRVAEVLSALKT